MPSAHKAFRLARTSDRIASTIAEFRFLSRRLPQLFRGGGGGLTAEKAAAMNLALNNATNVTKYYKDLGEKVKVEVITFGPGLHMLRADTSPVKARIETMALSMPEVSFKACGNTQENMQRAENKDIPIIPEAQVVKSGVVRVMELEEHGWTYVKP